jgi:hypothetical protein
MFKALLWKEWRALSALRWFGWGLVPVLGLGAVAREMGILGQQVTSQDLIGDVLPVVFAIAIWPLLGVMCAAQSFAGDRIVGTERFLLERPVLRRSIWWARLAGCFLTIAVVALSHAMLWLVLAEVYLPDPRFWLVIREAVVGLGLLTPLMILGGAVAGVLAPSTLAAALAGLVLGGLPFGLAWWGVTRAPWATLVDTVAFGLFPPWLLVLALPIASYVAFCRGEPSGRGKYWRGIAWITGPVMFVVILLLVGTPMVVTANAKSALNNMRLSHVPDGSAFLASPRSTYGMVGHSRSWWFDSEGDEIRRMDFSPDSVTWNEAGDRMFALLRTDLFQEVREYDTEGEVLQSWKNLTADEHWISLHRIREQRYVFWLDTIKNQRGFRELLEDGTDLLFESASAVEKYRSMQIVGTVEGAGFWVYGNVYPDGSSTGTESRYGDLLRWSPDEGYELVQSAIDVPLYRWLGTPFRRLSVDGRYWWRNPTPFQSSGILKTEIVATDTGEVIGTLPLTLNGVWLRGDRFCGSGKGTDRSAQLWCWDLESGAQQFERSEKQDEITRQIVVQASPARDYLLVNRAYHDPDKYGSYWIYDPSVEIYDADKKSWSTKTFEGLDVPGSSLQWAGSEALLVHRSGYLGMLNLTDGTTRHLIGRP